ncbi:MAG: chorismate mutase [Clostridia bacterium]|nr:chorismate mutase [Clostridia bacterium]
MDLQTCRSEISQIDEQIVALFQKRMALSKEIALFKKENRLPIYDSERERAVLNRVTALAGEELADYTGVLYQTVFDVSRSYQHAVINQPGKISALLETVCAETPQLPPPRAVIACQGAEGAYSQHACDKMFKYPSILYFSTFKDVCKAVDSGLCRYGVLPIENSTAGSVNEVYDLLHAYHFYITHSMKLHIAHTLLAPRGTKLEEIKEICSHEQALRQCSDFLTQSGCKPRLCQNTAQAAKLVAESGRTDMAAIGSRDCAELYDLEILSDDVQNNRNNYTRFICISKTPEIYPGAKKTSLLLTLAHKPGALYHAIARFASLGLNLTKLESRPIPGSDFEFLFYFDIEAPVSSPALRALIARLERNGEQFAYLGTYTED